MYAELLGIEMGGFACVLNGFFAGFVLMREGVAGDEAYVVDGDVGVLGDSFPAGGVGVELVGLEGDGGGGFVAIL